MSDHDSRIPRDDLIRAVQGDIELRDAASNGTGPVMAGHFAVTNQWTEIKSGWEGNFMERFAPGAFKKTIRDQGPKMRVLFQHGQDPSLGDQILGQITDLREDDQGAYYEAALFDGLPALLMNGLRANAYGASFRFSVLREDVNEEPGTSDHNPQGLPERTVKEARVAEFGPVTFPAYEGATAGVRSLTDDFLMRCFERDPERLKTMFEEFEERMDPEDLGILAEMTTLGTDYLAEQDETTDAAAITGMEAVLVALHDLSHIEVTETEPAEPMEMNSSAPSEGDAATESHLTDERREPQDSSAPALTATRKVPRKYLMSRKEQSSWVIPH